MLDGLSFAVAPQEFVCVIGPSGGGKSTLLQIVAGILHPTSGAVNVSGRVSALLELGAGFNPEFSGRDNVYLNGAIVPAESIRMLPDTPASATFFANIPSAVGERQIFPVQQNRIA